VSIRYWAARRERWRTGHRCQWTGQGAEGDDDHEVMDHETF